MGETSCQGGEVQRAPHPSRRNISFPRRSRRLEYWVPHLATVTYQKLEDGDAASRHQREACQRSPGTLAHPPGRADPKVDHHVLLQPPVRQSPPPRVRTPKPTDAAAHRLVDPRRGHPRGGEGAWGEHAVRTHLFSPCRAGHSAVSRTTRLGKGPLRIEPARRCRSPAGCERTQLVHLSQGSQCDTRGRGSRVRDFTGARQADRQRGRARHSGEPGGERG